MTPPQTLATDRPVRAIGHIRVSTEQAESCAGLDARRAAIEALASARGWSVEIVEETASVGKADRPTLDTARHSLAWTYTTPTYWWCRSWTGCPAAPTMAHIECARERGWVLVLLDLGVDLSTEAGDLAATVVLGTAQHERRMFGRRTREGLAARRAIGARLGRLVERSADVVARIVAEREAGRTFAAIAEGLTADGMPTPRGGRWAPARVREVCLSGARGP